jgi:phage protein U
MLAAIGPCVFTLKTNLQGIEYEWQGGYARHDVVGSSPAYEDMGAGESSITIKGVILPHAIGTDGGFAKLQVANQSRVPMPFILGSFFPIGWVIVDTLKREDSNLDAGGTGRMITFDARLLRIGTPSGFSMIASILRLL